MALAAPLKGSQRSAGIYTSVFKRYRYHSLEEARPYAPARALSSELSPDSAADALIFGGCLPNDETNSCEIQACSGISPFLIP